jgi:hypothetical protein
VTWKLAFLDIPGGINNEFTWTIQGHQRLCLSFSLSMEFTDTVFIVHVWLKRSQPVLRMSNSLKTVVFPKQSCNILQTYAKSYRNLRFLCKCTGFRLLLNGCPAIWSDPPASGAVSQDLQMIRLHGRRSHSRPSHWSVLWWNGDMGYQWGTNGPMSFGWSRCDQKLAHSNVTSVPKACKPW